MTDKLYTRRKIHIPKIDFKKLYSIRMLMLIFLITMLGIIISFLYSAFPIFEASCKTAASSKATKIVNEEVLKVMQDYSYNDLIHIEKDNLGKIIFIEANIVPINKVTSLIVSNIQKRIDESPRTIVFINLGSVTGISKLKNTGPQFDIELETAGNIVSDIRTEFESVGINQTLHKIYLDLNTSIGILTPFSNFSKSIESSVLLTQAVIVGEVPETYYEFTSEPEDVENSAKDAMF